jgi:DNA sulfur modification protein DndD
LILTKIVLQDFGVYYGRQTAEVGVEPGSSRNLVVISGLNGSGKTTLLTGLVFGLLGQEAAFLYVRGLTRKSRDIARREEELASFLNHQAFREGRRAAGVRLDLHDEGRLLTIERRWLFDERRRFREETLEVARDGWPLIAAGDEQLLDVYRDYLETHLPPRVVPFFFFDGEKIQQVAEEDEGQSLRRGIDTLLGFDVVRQLEADLDRLHDNYRREAERQESAASSLTDLWAQERQLEDHVGKLGAQLAQRESQTQDLRARLQGHEQQLEAILGRGHDAGDLLRMSQELPRLEGELATLQQQLEQQVDEVLVLALPRRSGRPWTTSDHLERHDRAGAAATVLDRLDDALFGPAAPLPDPPLLAQQREFLRQRLRQAWRDVVARPDDGAAEPGALVLPLSATELAQVEARLLQAHRGAEHLVRAVNRIEELQRHLARGQQVFRHAPREDGLRALLDEQAELNQELGRLAQQIDQSRRQLTALRGELQQLRSKRQQVEGESGRGARAIRLAELTLRMRQALEGYQQVLRPRKCAELRDYLRQMYQRLARKEDVIADVEVDQETYTIHLLDRAGHILPLRELSAGEKQIYAFSLLWALAKAARLQLPIVIDTPLGRLDSVHRGNLLRYYFPHAGQQVLVLSTDTELDRESLAVIQPHVARALRLVFLPREQRSVIETEAVEAA